MYNSLILNDFINKWKCSFNFSQETNNPQHMIKIGGTKNVYLSVHFDHCFTLLKSIL